MCDPEVLPNTRCTIKNIVWVCDYVMDSWDQQVNQWGRNLAV